MKRFQMEVYCLQLPLEYEDLNQGSDGQVCATQLLAHQC